MSYTTIQVGSVFELRDEAGTLIHTFPATVSITATPNPDTATRPTLNFAAAIKRTAPPKTKNPLLLAVLPISGSILNCSGVTSEGHMKLNDLQYPENTKKRPRIPGEGRSFAIRKVPMTTMDAASRLLLSVATTATTDATIYEDYEEFLRVNHGNDNRDLFLMLFVIDMVIQGIKPSSAKTYLAAILRSAKRTEQPIHGPHNTDAIRILNYLDAEEESTHARDISFAEADALVKNMSGVEQATVWFMLLCGGRVKDLARLKRHQISLLRDGRIAINFKYTKNHRTNLEQYTVIVPVQLEMPTSVVVVLQKRPDEYLFPLTVNDVNAAIHNAQGPMEPVIGERQRVTSYSFRRRFVQEVLAQNTNELGYTNWLEAAKLTAHKDLNVLRNRYTKVFQNTL